MVYIGIERTSEVAFKIRISTKVERDVPWTQTAFLYCQKHKEKCLGKVDGWVSFAGALLMAI